MSGPIIAQLLPISWERLHNDTRTLAIRLLKSQMTEPISTLVAITRGGMVPAGILGRELGIRLIDTFCVASYDEQVQRAPEVLKGVPGDGAGVLVVDDLVDSGVTARIVRAALPKAKIVTVYAKPAGRPFVDDYVGEVSQDTWIVFPWDAPRRIGEPDPT
jgi:xanthine phosphoribosyltransferase